MRDKTILLVEDSPDDEALTLIALHECNLAGGIVVARDGEEALDYLFGRGAWDGRDTGVQPELVLLDGHLPKLAGTEVLPAMRADARTRFVPVVMLTASTQARDPVESYANGANSYINKPADFDRFIDAVRMIGTYWLVHNRRPEGARG